MSNARRFPIFILGEIKVGKSAMFSVATGAKLAKTLRDRLNDPSNYPSIAEVFDDLAQQRDEIVTSQNINADPNYKDRGMWSSELNGIIKQAAKYAKVEAAASHRVRHHI